MRENVQIWSKKWFHETDDVHTKRNKKKKQNWPKFSAKKTCVSVFQIDRLKDQ